MATASSELHVTVVTPARSVYDAKATAVTVPAFDGEVGVLAGHAPLLAILGSGELRVTGADGKTSRMAVRGGFVQVSKNNVTVLTQEVASPDEVKPDALAAEEQKLAGEKPTKADEVELLQQKKSWAAARRKVAAKKGA
jgi:F-type H+-transporting ATPase subunit epsilon